MRLKAAELVRVDGDMKAAVELLRAGKADVYGSNINSLRALMAAQLDGIRGSSAPSTQLRSRSPCGRGSHPPLSAA